MKSGPYSTSASIVEPGRAAFVVQASPGSYQVTIEGPGGVSTSKTLVVTQSPAEISFVTLPQTVTPGEYVGLRVSGILTGTRLFIKQDETEVAIPVSNWPTDRGRPFGRVPTSVHPGPASFRVETFDDSGVTQQATVAVNIGSAPEPPELLRVSSPYGTGSAPGTEIDVSYFNASGGDIAEFRQGTFVKEVSVSPAVGAGALAARIGLPDALTGGNVSIRIRSTVNGIPTGWSNAVVFEVKDSPGAANRPMVEPNRFAIAGKRTEIHIWPSLDGGYPEYRLYGPGGDYTIVGKPRGSYYASVYALWPSEVPPGQYFIQVRYKLPQTTTEYSDADYVEVVAPEQDSGLSFSPTGQFIEICFANAFKFPYGAGLFDRLVISPSGTVSLGPARLDVNYYPWVEKLFDGTPRIAPFWSSGLQLEKSGAVAYSRSSTSFAVSFQDVPDYHNQLHNFSLELFPDGRFETRFGAMPTDTAGLVGYSLPGNVSLVAETDLHPLSEDSSDVSSQGLISRPDPGLWEGFSSDFDLAGRKLTFKPVGPFGTLSLAKGRFLLAIDWTTSAGSGHAQAVLVTEDTGYFWFFDPAIPELAVKVLDGRAVNGHFWVFYGALTDVGFNLTIYNLVTGERKVYTNPPGVQAGRVDTLAFEDGSAPLASGAPSWAFASIGPELSLADGRFKLNVTWRTPTGASGSGIAFPLTSDAGAFWFFNDQNLELFAKVVDGRQVNGHYWIFHGALTDLDYDLSVTDTVTGALKTYHGQQGVVSAGYDIGSF